MISSLKAVQSLFFQLVLCPFPRAGVELWPAASQVTAHGTEGFLKAGTTSTCFTAYQAAQGTVIPEKCSCHAIPFAEASQEAMEAMLKCTQLTVAFQHFK